MSDEAKDTQPKEARPEGDTSGWRVVDFSKLKNPPAAFAAGVYLIVVIIGGASLIAGLGAFFVLGYDMFFADAKDRIEGAKVFFSVLVALIGGPVLIWRALTAHWAAQAARHQADTAREGHYTDLFTKAVEQLGATREVKETIEIDGSEGEYKKESTVKTEPNLEVRLGAIYALERIAQDSERDHWSIMEVLCTYIRNSQNCGLPTPRPVGAMPVSEAFRIWERVSVPRLDIQAALTVLGRRTKSRIWSEEQRKLFLDLSGSNLQHAKFDSGKFPGARLCKTNLDAASFDDAILIKVDYSEARLDHASFVGARLEGAWFNQAHLKGVRFDDANLVMSRFSRANLDDASFMRANASKASFVEAKCDGVWFHSACFEEANFSRANLQGSAFVETDLARANFHGAYLFNVDLSMSLNLSSEQISEAFGDATTTLPFGVSRPGHWPDKELSPYEILSWLQDVHATTKKS